MDININLNVKDCTKNNQDFLNEEHDKEIELILNMERELDYYDEVYENTVETFLNKSYYGNRFNFYKNAMFVGEKIELPAGFQEKWADVMYRLQRMYDLIPTLKSGFLDREEKEELRKRVLQTFLNIKAIYGLGLEAANYGNAEGKSEYDFFLSE